MVSRYLVRPKRTAPQAVAYGHHPTRSKVSRIGSNSQKGRTEGCNKATAWRLSSIPARQLSLTENARESPLQIAPDRGGIEPAYEWNRTHAANARSLRSGIVSSWRASIRPRCSFDKIASTSGGQGPTYPSWIRRRQGRPALAQHRRRNHYRITVSRRRLLK